MKVYIISPDTGNRVSIDEWRKEKDPTRASVIAIDTDDEHTLLMRKSYLPGEYTFEEAQDACARFIEPELDATGIVFRCPTRKECIDLYDARFQGLDEAVKLIGGDFATIGRRHWTCERDADPRYGASYAWYSIGYYGYASYSVMCNTFSALPVALLK